MMALTGTCTLNGVIGVPTVTLETGHGFAWAEIKTSGLPFYHSRPKPPVPVWERVDN